MRIQICILNNFYLGNCVIPGDQNQGRCVFFDNFSEYAYSLITHTHCNIYTIRVNKYIITRLMNFQIDKL